MDQVYDPTPRTLNKTLFIRPPKNTYSFNELVTLWEKLIGKILEKTYVPEKQLLKQIQESPIPINILLAVSHSIFVNSDGTNFEIKPSIGFEASELYPGVKHTTVEETLSQAPCPLNIVLAICHSNFVDGDYTVFEIKSSFGFEASELYPAVKYTTVEEGISRFV
ncbi:Isoflavone reductase-like protein IRL [Hibiscus syriacus]|uniref:Isoflavone reductase-like protein IRL n=1 Tax=Hibiscus syriacus TaxID=106335 RepID=A0A6A2W9H4_HIBSY|nr:Isoflavone reductase-like protein IRL [Hibiscus syriacus]